MQIERGEILWPLPKSCLPGFHQNLSWLNLPGSYRVKELGKCCSLKYRAEQEKGRGESECKQAVNQQILTLLSPHHKPGTGLSAFYGLIHLNLLATHRSRV